MKINGFEDLEDLQLGGVRLELPHVLLIQLNSKIFQKMGILVHLAANTTCAGTHAQKLKLSYLSGKLNQGSDILSLSILLLYYISCFRSQSSISQSLLKIQKILKIKMPSLSSARYGKDNIRVCKVSRDPSTGTQSVTEMTVTILLSGGISTSYTEADNSVVVPTDTMKQTTYIMAKQHPVNPPELFAAMLSNHFVTTYPHITTANVKVVQHRWARISVDSKPHPHSFSRDSNETRHAEATCSKSSSSTNEVSISIKSSIVDLLVLKSTGSAFHGFIQDSYTILKPTDDRILSTSVVANWTWVVMQGLSAVEAAAKDGLFDHAWTTARDITLKTFAEEASASVQATMYKMAVLILGKVKEVKEVEYVLPNKHYFEIGTFCICLFFLLPS